MSLTRLLLKEWSQKSETEVILTPDDTLFHGTVEDFEPENISTGGYDNILWTTTSSLIAQTYIPDSSSSTLINTQYFFRPKQHDEYAEQLGIVFKDVEWEGREAKSWKIPDAFKFPEAYKKNEENYAKARKLTKRIEATDDPEEKNRLRKERDKLSFFDIDKLKAEYVNNKLSALGYEPRRKDSYRNEHSWELKTKNGKIMPASYKSEGRLFILKPKTNLLLFDYTYAEEREPDLMNVDYHEHGLFRKVEKKGYDGIKITDFAQVEDRGNVGHMSYGIFKDSISKLKIYEVIKAYHPDDFEERSWKLRTRHSKEYEEFLKRQ